MARKYTSGMLTGWLREIAARLPDDVLRPLAKFASTRIGARATDTFMREGKGERGPNRTPVLRRMTARLARSLTDYRRKDAFNRTTVRAAKVTIEKGTSVPYAGVHEDGYAGSQQVPAHMRGGHPVRAHVRQMTIPARPFLRPAAEAEHATIAERGKALVTSLIRRVVGGSAPAAMALFLFFPPAPQRAVYPQPVRATGPVQKSADFVPCGAVGALRKAVPHVHDKRCAVVRSLGSAGTVSGGAT
ncbi:MAG: hypothetical protein IAE99_07890 [Rhodothermales bacterium]|nr:hypothetical protein [Rhodothermales bacterium]